MSLLDNLAQGLRGAAGVLNPDVQKQTFQQDNLREQDIERRRNLAATQIIRGAESGAIEPEAAQIQLQRLGYGGIPVGPDAATQQRRDATDKERQFRSEISSLGENPTQEQLAQVAAKYGSPDKVMDVHMRSIDRREMLQQRTQEFQDRMTQAAAAAEQRLQQAREANASREQIAQMQIESRNQLQQMMMEGRRQLAGLAGSLRQPPAPHIFSNADGVFAIGRDGVANPVTDATGKPISGKTTERVMPANAATRLNENQTNLTRAETALALVQGKDVGAMSGDKNATGFKGFLPDKWLQRADPQGVDARAAIADLGSLVIHERSGAAVTAAEFPRLAPFIPTASDDSPTVEKKLKRFVQIYKQEVDSTRNYYEEAGFRVPAAPKSPANAGWSIKEK